MQMRLSGYQADAAIKNLRQKAPHLISHALNRGARSAKTFMARAVSSDIRLPVRKVAERIHVDEATRVDFRCRFRADAKRIPVYEFNARGPYPSRGKGRGVRARTRAGTYPRAFIARMPSGHWGVFERKGKSKSRKRKPPGSPGLPIRELKGPSIAHVFIAHRPAGIDHARVVVNKNLVANFRFFTSQQGS